VSSTGTDPSFDERTTIVVADGLAARQWELHLSAAAIESGRRAWVTPPILGYGAWLEQLWQRTAGSREAPLAPSQALALWRRVVAESAEGAELLGERGAAQWAAEAWDLACRWDIDLARERAAPSQTDYRAFLAWSRRYAAALDELGCVDRSIIARRLPDAPWRATERVVLAGLDDPAPRERALLERIGRDGRGVETWPESQSSARVARVRLADARDELRSAIAWARERLAAAPGARIAIVVAGLRDRRLELERAAEASAGGGDVPVWHAGGGLADAPSLGAALDSLTLGSAAATFETLSRWLRSPFFGTPDERSARAALDRELRRDVRAQLTFGVAYRETALAALIERAAPRAARSLAAALHELDGIERATPTRWATVWQRALTLLEWGGATDARDAQRWQSALDAFARLTPILGEIEYGTALTELERALDVSLPAPLPVRGIHVLERVADVGPGYDAAWLTGLTDDGWPEPARSNPLLPRALQRRLEMPWSSPGDARARAARTLDRVRRRVTTLVASWPARVYDYETEPSPALRGWPELDVPESPRAHRGRARETVVDRAPPLRAGELRGGTGVLNKQARCPLRAFCEYRLHARALDRPSAGVTLWQRGMATHRALEWLLEDLPEQAQFAAKAAGLDVLAERALTHEVFRDARGPLRALLAVESARLAAALKLWLELELGRAPFSVVAVERREQIEIAQQTVRVRIDRLDRLADGRLAIVDYKTGANVSSADWFAERPRDVQVPLYAAHAKEPVTAAVLTAVNATTASYRGFWPDRAFPGKPSKISAPDWPAQLARWRLGIDSLVRELAAGDTRVLLRDVELAEGSYAPLTRIDEQLAVARGSLERW
jgi:ATP-dependent helicase/nuclease subunit B